MVLTLLVDFGSTYTKVTAVDENKKRIVGTAQAPSTVEDDITIGLNNAISSLEQKVNKGHLHFKTKFASSSAAGGLRMVAIGLVPSLTVEAARKAALNAGSKLIDSYSYKLTQMDLRKIISQKPDIILLSGGTDGGDEEVILHNANQLATTSFETHYVVAGNRICNDIICDIFKMNNKSIIATENVMPEMNVLNIEPVRKCIRELFIEKIIFAKGIEKAKALIDGILMPTPEAVLNAAEMLALGIGKEKGLGEILVIDVGGATTDVHSICNGKPLRPEVFYKGLPEPFAKRTVEGDLGVRYNCLNIMESVGIDNLVHLTGLKESFIEQVLNIWTKGTFLTPETRDEIILDHALARCAVQIAVRRHSGSLEKIYSPMGETFVQYGKDLTNIDFVVGIGGPLRNALDPFYVLSSSMYESKNPSVLKPANPDFFIDENYIFYAMGLLSQTNPELAVLLLKNNLKPISKKFCKRIKQYAN